MDALHPAENNSSFPDSVLTPHSQLHHHISHLAANEVVAQWRSQAEETTNQAKTTNSSEDSSKWMFLIFDPASALWLWWPDDSGEERF